MTADDASGTTLAAQQRAWLEALWAPRSADGLEALGAHARPGPQRERGLRAYRSNGRLLARRVLEGAYPTVAGLLGEENFAAIAQLLWLRHPPLRGDLAQWGADLPACLETLPDLADAEPHLPDVARLEWALHEAATAADGMRQDASFALLTSHGAEQLTLVLADGTCCIDSPWPVVSLVLAQRDAPATLDAAAARLREGPPECAVVWREGLRPCVRLAQPGEAAFIGALQENRSLADALEAASALRFDQWLAPAVQRGMLLGVAMLPSTRTPA